ncbi:unnamed protein product [Lactuca saligna]|uniref:NB-ARC domain-containing protein n=1 Tax=Lactuca saligna TaxID=75948 RepID=A0AA36EKC9_LACSI|nr:unnamed protein product [Lactuca saligna]
MYQSGLGVFGCGLGGVGGGAGLSFGRLEDEDESTKLIETCYKEEEEATQYEAEFIIDIVNVIRKKLDYKALYIEDKLVGIRDNVAAIECWLQDPSPNAVILLIDWMGGIGKTTIAKCIYNSNIFKYDVSCFLANINDTSNQPGGLLRLQSQLLSTILKTKREETIWNVHEGTIKITNAICNKAVLLVLDDVTTLQQLVALLGPQSFYPGSKVIITTRHKWLLTAFKVHPKVQSVQTLSTHDSIELFSLYAFNRDQPIEPYTVQSKLFVHHCMGHPLALKVLGSSLHGNTKDVWEDTMRKLQVVPNPEIQKVLQISFETLSDDKDKDLFLHVACFFEGEEKEYIVKLLAQCDLYPVVGIKNLMDRCLLNVEHGRVTMHQLIKEMGREVVRQESPKDPGKRSRLWQDEDCFNVLRDNSGTKKVEGLMLDMLNMKDAKSTSAITINNLGKRSFEEYLGKTRYGNDAILKSRALEKMKNLMLLQLNYVTFSGTCKKLPKKLRLLRWHGCSLEAIPGDTSLEKLVILDMSDSNLKRVWDGFKFIGSLQILNLSYSSELIETPDFVGLPGLERLILTGCTSLIKIDESIAYLKELVLLDLTNCRNIRDIPCLPRSLESLQMSGCPNIAFPRQVRCLELISSFSLLKNMDLSDCNLLDDSFPNNWSGLVSLVYLNIDGSKVTSLPKCIQTLSKIRTLSVECCSKIQSILGVPESVDTLYIRNNISLKKVQPAPNSRTLVYHDKCENLCDMVGRYKLQSIEKVERKIIRYLGLELNAVQGMELGLEVLHEFGIFSTFVPEEQIPSSFMFNKKGPKFSFKVPWHHNSLRISGFNMCVLLNQLPSFPYMEIELHNETKDLVWNYIKGDRDVPKGVKNIAWLSLWRCGNILEGGDEIVISINNVAVEACCINLIYEDDEQLDGEGSKAHRVLALDQISWSDRMHKDISDYAYSGMRHSFKSDNWSY